MNRQFKSSLLFFYFFSLAEKIKKEQLDFNWIAYHVVGTVIIGRHLEVKQIKPIEVHIEDEEEDNTLTLEDMDEKSTDDPEKRLVLINE